MVVRNFNIKRHLTALIITALIFIVGILIGLNLTNERIKSTENFARIQKADYDSLQLQYLYLQKGSCPVLEKTLEQNIQDLEAQRARLEDYVKDSDAEEFKLIEREYTLSEIKYWLLAKQSKIDCGSDAVSVLYFYSDAEGQCKDCSAQGTILSFLKEQFKDRLLVFSIDVNVEDPMLSILKKTKEVNDLPTLVIEEDSYSGLLEQEKLKTIICSHYKEPHSEC